MTIMRAGRRAASLSPYQARRRAPTLSPKRQQPYQQYNPSFNQRTIDELTAINWLGIRTGLLTTADIFFDQHPHLWNYFPDPPEGVTKKRPLQRWISDKNRYCRDPNDPTKFRKPKKDEVPTEKQAPDAHAFIARFKAHRMSSSSSSSDNDSSDDEVSVKSPPKIEPKSNKAKSTPKKSDPPIIKPKRTPTPTIIMSDPPAKPDGVVSFDDIDYETARAYSYVHAANPDSGTNGGKDFIVWRTKEVKVKNNRNENVVDKISLLIDVGSEAAADLVSKAYLEEDGKGVIVYTPMTSPHLTKLWNAAKEEIGDLCENGVDDNPLPMLNAVSTCDVFVILWSSSDSHFIYSSSSA